MTPNDVIAEVRRLIQDTRSPNRLSDAVLLGFINQTLKRMALLRPDLFAVVADFTLTANTVLQSCPTDSIRLIELFQVKNGGVITEVSRQILDRTSPTWVSDDAGVPINYMRHVQNPNKFFVYPRPRTGVVLVGEYAQSPPNYTGDQQIAYPPDGYFPTLVTGTVFLAESIDDEFVSQPRAQMFRDMFLDELNTNLQSRALTDMPAAGLDPNEVV